MSYDLVISRAEYGQDGGSQRPISEDEWHALVQSDSTLTLSKSDYYERRKPDGSIERIQIVLWTAHEDQPPFMLIDGAIQIKSPDDVTIQKMVEMAGKLKARIVGEEGETYPLTLPTAPPQPAKSGFTSWPLWKRLVAAFLFGCALLIFKILIFGD